MATAGHVLVVDDDPEVGQTLHDVLRHLNYAVTLALSGTAALRQVTNLKPDVVLLDLSLPDMAGLDVLARLRRDDPGLPVIIVSWNQDMDVAQAALGRGIFDYISKPFNMTFVEHILAAAVASRT